MANPTKYGKLIQIMPSGHVITLVEKDLWGNLENEKKLRIRQGVPAYQLRLKYI